MSTKMERNPVTETDIEFYETEDSLDLEGDEETKESWKISGRRSADWALAVRRRSELEIAEAQKLRDERIERAKDHCAEVERREQATIDFFDSKLREWYETYLIPEGVVNDKKKTYSNLENGTISKHAGRLSLKLDAEQSALVIEFLESDFELSKFLKIHKSVRVAELKAAFPAREGSLDVVTADGEIIPGVQYERAAETFVVKTK